MSPEVQMRVLDLVLNSADGRDRAFAAIEEAKKGNFDKAEEELTLAARELHEAHLLQTGLIQDDAGGELVDVTLLVIHAHDHYVTAKLAFDMAKEMVVMYEELFRLKGVIVSDLDLS